MLKSLGEMNIRLVAIFMKFHAGGSVLHGTELPQEDPQDITVEFSALSKPFDLKSLPKHTVS